MTHKTIADAHAEMRKMYESTKKLYFDSMLYMHKEIDDISITLKGLSKDQRKSFSVAISAILHNMDNEKLEKFLKEFETELDEHLSDEHMEKIITDLSKDKNFISNVKEKIKDGSISDLIEYIIKMMETNGIYDLLPGGKIVGKICGMTICALTKQLSK